MAAKGIHSAAIAVRSCTLLLSVPFSPHLRDGAILALLLCENLLHLERLVGRLKKRNSRAAGGDAERRQRRRSRGSTQDSGAADGDEHCARSSSTHDATQRSAHADDALHAGRQAAPAHAPAAAESAAEVVRSRRRHRIRARHQHAQRTCVQRRPYHFCYVDGVDNNNNVLTTDGRVKAQDDVAAD